MGAPADGAVDKLHSDIDARLDRLRAALADVVPATPRDPVMAPAPEPPSKRDEAVLLYMPSFVTQQMRLARKAAATRASSAGTRSRSGGSGGGNARATAPRRPPSAGSRPPGFRIEAKHPSTPAYTMRAKIVLSNKLDPAIPDDGPGPGAYDIAKY